MKVANLNKVILMGNLTRAPDVRRTNSGTSIAKLGMAINRRWRDGQGEQREDTTFVDVEVWGKTADFCRDYLHKGDSVLIDGRLKMDSWEDKTTGKQRSKLLVTAESVQSCTPRQGNAPQQQNQQHGQPSPNRNPQPPPQRPQPPVPPPFPGPPQGSAGDGMPERNM